MCLSSIMSIKHCTPFVFQAFQVPSFLIHLFFFSPSSAHFTSMLCSFFIHPRSSCSPFISVLSPSSSVVLLDVPPLPTAASHMLLFRLGAVTVSVAGLGNNVPRAPLSCSELFRQHNMRLHSYVNWNYKLQNTVCLKREGKAST